MSQPLTISSLFSALALVALSLFARAGDVDRSADAPFALVAIEMPATSLTSVIADAVN